MTNAQPDDISTVPGVTLLREIVLTGGPCAGKSTGIAWLADRLRTEGWRVLVVPEAATMFITGGIHDVGTVAEDPLRWAQFQKALLGTQALLRDGYRRMIAGLDDARAVILYDRAECDNAAYIRKEWFEAVLAEAGTTMPEVRDSYDLVVHLVTAADGAVDAYTTANNEARRETVEEALDLDRRTLAGWVGHPHLSIIGNGPGGFDAKLNRLYAVVSAALADPPLEAEHKFLLAGRPDFDHPAFESAVRAELDQGYIPGDGPPRRIRRRIESGSATYSSTVKRPHPSRGVRVEVESTVSPIEYVTLCAQVPKGMWITKTRWALTWEGHVYVIDRLRQPQDAWILEAELSCPDDEVVIPPFVRVAADVTDDPTWSMAGIVGAHRDQD